MANENLATLNALFAAYKRLDRTSTHATVHYDSETLEYVFELYITAYKKPEMVIRVGAHIADTEISAIRRMEYCLTNLNLERTKSPLDEAIERWVKESMTQVETVDEFLKRTKQW